MTTPDQTAFSKLQKASFDGVEFPFESISTIGVMRDFIHEFPHTPTGKPELMGRKNYEFKLRCPFFRGLPFYPDLWPNRLYSLRTKFEIQRIGELHIPTFGTVNAYIRSIEIETTSQILSGERVNITFIENDNPQDFISSAITTVGPVSIDAQLEQVIAKYKQKNIGDKAPRSNANDLGDVDAVRIGSLLTALDDSVGALIAVRDQVDVYGSLVEAKTQRVAAQCDALDKAFRINNGDAAAIQANLALWANIVSSLNDIQSKQTDLLVYITPRLMTINDLSIVLYNDTTHSTELLQINPIDDANNIPPNTRIKYYPND